MHGIAVLQCEGSLREAALTPLLDAAFPQHLPILVYHFALRNEHRSMPFGYGFHLRERWTLTLFLYAFERFNPALQFSDLLGRSSSVGAG